MTKKKIVMRAKNIAFSYDAVPALQNVSFEIEEGDFVAVLGPNGAGKTTLAKLIIGLIPMQSGTLEILGRPASRMRGPGIIGYMPQRYAIDRLFPGTVGEILSAPNAIDPKIAVELGTESLRHKRFVDLSGGQQQRVLITLALQNNPKILILDEPTVGVDAKTETDFLTLLKHMNTKHHITILLITHDVGMVPNVANKVLCVNHNMCCAGLSSDTENLLQCVYGSYEEHHHHGGPHARNI